jgi:glyoxylase-like metal-dependent hydrolase (beta-lactamase superfamily II)
MELRKIKGNTYYINSPTNIGVFCFKNKNCLLIDTGVNSSAARKNDEILVENNLHPKYIINTHSHLDHCGGNSFFKNTYSGCYVYASSKEKLYIENIELQAAMLFSSFPVKDLEPRSSDAKVDFVLDYGVNKINDEKFQIIKLRGHSPEHIGIISSDKVCFLGDSVFSEEIIRKYSFPYLFHIQHSEKTLMSIQELDAEYFVISHADKIYDKREIVELVDLNLKNIYKYKTDILEILERPLTREELMENLVRLNDLYLSFKQYHINLSSISAFIKWLYEDGLINYSIENGKLYYYRKDK